MPKMTIGNETISSSGLDKVAMLGQDGLKGIAMITGRAIVLNAVMDGRYHIALNSDGTVSTKIYKRRGIMPLIKLNSVHTDGAGFTSLLGEVRYGRRSVYELFSGLLEGVIMDMEEYQSAFLEKKDPERYATLEVQKMMLKKLRHSLLKSDAGRPRPAEDLLSMENKEKELDVLVGKALEWGTGSSQ